MSLELGGDIGRSIGGLPGERTGGGEKDLQNINEDVRPINLCSLKGGTESGRERRIPLKCCQKSLVKLQPW